MMSSPIIKATIAATALSSASNILAQFLEAYRDKKPFIFDYAKFLQFVLVTFIDAPPNYRWQQLLERSFPSYVQTRLPSAITDVEKQEEKVGENAFGTLTPKLNLRNTIIKTLIDCTLGAVLNTVAFLFLMGLFKRQSIEQIWYNITHETIGVIAAGVRVWPFASIISFSCVPVERRIVFLNFVGLIWGVYMSIVATRV
ncbi:hypothetical protein F5Y16DRAFT_385559 [Xylariaceae sp. FL0255]|nr:hypothetical protein F5Y16DRAFT_385559 [Xylariaceae sp. FL0255]